MRARHFVTDRASAYAPTVLITGLDGSPADTRRHYLEWRARVLVDAGVPPERLVFEGTANNSYQEAVATLALMRARDWKTVLVVSDPPHMRRLNWVWGTVFAGSGLSYRLVAGRAGVVGCRPLVEQRAVRAVCPDRSDQARVLRRQVFVAGRGRFSFTVAVRQQRTGRPETGSVGMVGDNRIIAGWYGVFVFFGGGP